MLSKIFFILGFIFIFLGLVFHFGWWKYVPFGRLPGDIVIERENFKFYFPITSSIILSIIISLIIWFFSKKF